MLRALLRRALLPTALLLLLPAVALSAAPDIDSILTKLAKPVGATTPFVEVRFSSLMAKPLVVSGELEYLGPDALARTVHVPFEERTEIRAEVVTMVRQGEKPRRFSLKRAPELRALLNSFSAVLAGNREALDREFELTVSGDDSAWTLLLTPKDARVRKRVRDIEIIGKNSEPLCLVTTEPDSDATVTLLGHTATERLPNMLSRSDRSDCR